MKLPITEFGTKDAHPIVLVHGLFGQGRNLAGIARSLAKSRYVLTVDLRNHGSAPWDDDHSYEAMAGDILDTISEFESVDLLGHSMGGKASMIAALNAPEKIHRLIIADIAPVSYEHSHIGLIDAMLSIDLSIYTSRNAIDDVLKPLITDKGTRAFLIHGIDLRAKPPKWQNNLEVLKKSMPQIVAWPNVRGQYNGPTLFLGGENSDYILSEHRDVIKEYFPNAHITHLKDAGHWLHAEQPRYFTQIVDNFFKD